MKEFKYDVILLIHSVKDRPCLWDKSVDSYKDRLERRKAWEEIFCILDDVYETMSPEEKRLTGELILNKWTNIRDTFVKSLRLKMGKPRRKYILYEHLQFLIKTISQEESEQIEEVTYLKEEHGSETDEIIPRKRSRRLEKEEEYVPNTSKNDTKERVANSKKRKKKEVHTKEIDKQMEFDESGNDIDFVEIDAGNAATDHRLMNEDEAFFASLLPTIVKYNEDERLEFRIEVLSIMKKIKDNRKWNTEES